MWMVHDGVAGGGLGRGVEGGGSPIDSSWIRVACPPSSVPPSPPRPAKEQAQLDLAEKTWRRIILDPAPALPPTDRGGSSADVAAGRAGPPTDRGGSAAAVATVRSGPHAQDRGGGGGKAPERGGGAGESAVKGGGGGRPGGGDRGGGSRA